MTTSIASKHSINTKKYAKFNNLTGVILGLNILIISTIFEGVFFEIIGLIALCYLFITNARLPFLNKHERKRVYFEFKFCLIALCFVILFVCVQILVLKLNISAVVRLYGITKTLFAIPIIFICTSRLYNNGKLLHSILPILIIMNYFNIIYMITGVGFFNLFNGSLNYVGAIDIILLPFVLKFDKKISQLQRILFLIPFIILTVFSGSRSVLLVAILMFVGMMILEKNKKNKRNYILIALIVCIIGGVTILTDNEMIMRAISVFFDRSDAARSNLTILAQRQFDSYSIIQQIFGSGNNLVVSQLKPVHNFFWEILLTYGKLGLMLWLLFMITMIIYLLKKRPNDWKYIVLILGCALLINYVQPFMTTGFLFQIVVSISIIQLFNRGFVK